jgi:aminoglycoside phosphotransferase (APT) family kinase protein
VPTWDAELVVDEALARRLVDRFPEVAGAPLRLLSTGWDRTVWLAGGRYAFGFPRREVVVPGVERELEWLPRLAPLLPCPIPVPRFVGEPSEEFPWPFFGSELVPGVEPGDADLDGGTRTAVGVDLAAFLRALHAVDGAGLPGDGNRRADMPFRVPKTRETLREIGRDEPAFLDEAEELPPPPEPATVAHGDLHFRHVLVEGGRLGGVIDWVDICRGDPSIDLVAYWCFVPPGGRDAFAGAYGGIDDAQLLRARVLSLNLCSVLAAYARDQGHARLEREALAGLDRTLS